jgi:AcrR family transcriptional regulator
MKNKEYTKRKLIDAVGEILLNHGFKGVRISKVANVAGVDRKLVYRYFGNLDGLIEAYIIENDYWMIFGNHLRSLFKEHHGLNGKAMVKQILQEQFNFFIREEKMQALILMELSGSNPLLQSIHNVRESLGQQFYKQTDAYFKGSEVNFRAVAALLVGGIYYMILHTKHNGYAFAGVDLKSDEGRSSILEAMSNIIDWAYAAAANR